MEWVMLLLYCWKLYYCCRNILISSKITFQKCLAINICILSASCYLNKTSWTNSKNIYQTIDLIGLIKVIIYNLPEYFTAYHSIRILRIRILLRIFSIVFDKFFEYVILLFCLLNVQRGLIILFIFDSG